MIELIKNHKIPIKRTPKNSNFAIFRRKNSTQKQYKVNIAKNSNPKKSHHKNNTKFKTFRKI